MKTKKKAAMKKRKSKAKSKMIRKRILLPPVTLPVPLVEKAVMDAIFARQNRAIEAAALLMREIVCEQIYRQRGAWDIEHPNNALGVRTIHPRDVAQAVVVEVADMPSKQLRQLAAEILNEPDTNAWPDVVTRFFMVRA